MCLAQLFEVASNRKPSIRWITTISVGRFTQFMKDNNWPYSPTDLILYYLRGQGTASILTNLITDENSELTTRDVIWHQSYLRLFLSGLRNRSPAFYREVLDRWDLTPEEGDLYISKQREIPLEKELVPIDIVRDLFRKGASDGRGDILRTVVKILRDKGQEPNIPSLKAIIAKVRKERGINNGVIPQHSYDKIREMAATDASVVQIAGAAGVSEPTVRSYIAAMIAAGQLHPRFAREKKIKMDIQGRHHRRTGTGFQ